MFLDIAHNFLPVFFFFRFDFFLSLNIITMITIMNNKKPAPPHARAIISSVDKVEKKPRTPSCGSVVVAWVSTNSLGETTP